MSEFGSHNFEICNSVCPICRQCGRHKIHFPKHRLLEFEIHSFLPKSGQCPSHIDLTNAQEEDTQ